MREANGRGRLQALLLDLDGTVLDTHTLIFRCFNETLLYHVGRAVGWDRWARSVGLPLEEMFALALADHGGADLTPADIAADYRRRMLAREEPILPFPRMTDTLSTLRESGVRLAVVTAKHGMLAHLHLDRTGLTGHFEAVVTGDQCEFGKPHPEPFLRALSLLGVEPRHAAGVGDSACDVLATRAAGALGVGAAWGALDPTGLVAAGPDLVLDRPEELLRLPGLVGADGS